MLPRADFNYRGRVPVREHMSYPAEQWATAPDDGNPRGRLILKVQKPADTAMTPAVDAFQQ
jgi:hypothetical protein